jgi:hypothetical protein
VTGRAKISLRTPGFFKFQAALSLGLSLWMFYPWPNTRAALVNSAEIALTLLALTAIVFGLFLSYRVTYNSDGLYIRPGGWWTLAGLASEHFVAFDEIKSMTREFDRGGGGHADWLMFGYLQLHTYKRRDDADQLVLRQIFLNREQLAGLLQQLRNDRPDIVDQDVVNALANG